MRALFCLLLVPLSGVWKTAASQQQLTRPEYVPLVRSILVQEQRQPIDMPISQPGDERGPNRSGGCVLSQLSLGLAGMVLAGGGTAAMSNNKWLPLVAAGAGATGGIMLGSYAGRCHASLWGATAGAAVGVLVGVTWGKAFADTRTEREDWQLAAGYIVMLPLSWFGAQLGR